MGSMHTGLECHPEHFGELARFYAERARGGAALIVTGGFAPNHAGRMKDEPGTFEWPDQVAAHRQITERSEEHTSELQSRQYLVCRLLLEKKKKEEHKLN